MERRCPLCHDGHLEEVSLADGTRIVQCTQYPACRFFSESWELVSERVARFRHPVSRGQS